MEKMSKDSLGDRMKGYYEARTQTHLPRRTNSMIRLDGKSFHTYTKGFKRPYDLGLMRIMDQTAIALCERIQGAKMAFVQSDEISIVMTDYDDQQTDAWFDGNVQKITSISASIATAAFNNGMYLDEEILANMDKVAYFDSRVFTLPSQVEVVNCFLWRQQDATKNSISMAAQSMFSHKELHKKNGSDMQEMMWQKGVNWNDYPVGFKRGRAIVKETYPHSGQNKKTGELVTTQRSRWVSVEPPIFSQDPSFVLNRLPKGE
jgi:tRNA(His) 5'-end guanylyltransferase